MITSPVKVGRSQYESTSTVYNLSQKTSITFVTEDDIKVLYAAAGLRLVANLFAIIIVIIITLFQEDNIFVMNASLTYGPQTQRYACV